VHLGALGVAVAKGGTVAAGKDEGEGAQRGRQLGMKEGIMVWVVGKDGRGQRGQRDGLVGGRRRRRRGDTVKRQICRGITENIRGRVHRGLEDQDGGRHGGHVQDWDYRHCSAISGDSAFNSIVGGERESDMEYNKYYGQYAQHLPHLAAYSSPSSHASDELATPPADHKPAKKPRTDDDAESKPKPTRGSRSLLSLSRSHHPGHAPSADASR